MHISYLGYLDKPSPLKLSIDVKELELPAGNVYTVSCFVDQQGFPHGKFKWFKHDSFISTLTGVVVTRLKLAILYLYNLKKEDTGNYKCTYEQRIES